MDATVEPLIRSRRTGRPRGAGRLWVVPFLGPDLRGREVPRPLGGLPRNAPVRLSERDGQALVEEVQAYNGMASCVIGLEGELLAGGYQDRMLSASSLIPGRAATILPTTCSEEGRFEGSDPRLRATGCIAPPRYRRRLRLGLYSAGGDGEGPAARQRAIWREIEEDRKTLDVPGEGVSLLRLQAAAGERCAPLATGLGGARRESGWMFFVGGRLAGADLFASARVAALYGPGLLAAAAYDGLVEGLRGGPAAVAPDPAAGEDHLAGFWRDIGSEMDGALVVREEGTSGTARLSLDSPALVGSLLVHGDTPLHLSLFPALYADDVTALP